jgi:hypothetical protein
LIFAIGSTPGFDDGALGSFHGSRRVTQFLQWAAPPPGRHCCRWRASSTRPLSLWLHTFRSFTTSQLQ